MGLDDDLRALAERQHGAVARHQAHELGATASGVRGRLEGPAWEAATPRVLRLLGAARTPHQRLMVAVLDAGHDAVVSDTSAAALWGLPGFGYGAVHLSRQQGRSGRRPLGGARLHRPRLLPPTHVTRRDLVPVTTLARTLFDLAAVEHPARVARLVDTVVARAPSVLATLHDMLHELGARGREGVASMREVLAERPPGSVPRPAAPRHAWSRSWPRPARRPSTVRSTWAATSGSAASTLSTAAWVSSWRWTARCTTRAASTETATAGGTRRCAPPASTPWCASPRSRSGAGRGRRWPWCGGPAPLQAPPLPP